MECMTILRTLWWHAKAKSSSIPHRHVPQMLEQCRGLRIAPHWHDWLTVGGGGTSCINTNSLPLSLHCSGKRKKNECPDFCWGHITINDAWPMHTSDWTCAQTRMRPLLPIWAQSLFHSLVWIVCFWLLVYINSPLHTLPVKSFRTPTRSKVFLYFLHCRIIVKTSKLWNNTYGIT